MSLSAIKALREERFIEVNALRALYDKADAEKRSTLSAEERTESDRREARIKELDEEVERRERVERLQPQLDSAAESRAEASTREKRDGKPGHPLDAPEYRAAFVNALRFGRDRISADEQRTLSIAGAHGETNAVPPTFMREVIRFARLFGNMRGIARQVETSDGNTITWPSLTGHAAAGWIDELGSYPVSDPTLGSFSISAYKAGLIIRISDELLRDSIVDTEALVAQEMGEALALLENTAFWVGNGTKKPTGLLTTIATGQAGATGQTTSVIYDDLVKLIYSVLSPYRQGAKWVVNDQSVMALRLLKDTMGRPLWQDGLTADAPATLLGYPIVTDPDVPVMGASAKSIVFGNFQRGYIVRDVTTDSTIMRLNELFRQTGEIGFQLAHRLDGKQVDAGAVKAYANSAT